MNKNEKENVLTLLDPILKLEGETFKGTAQLLIEGLRTGMNDNNIKLAILHELKQQGMNPMEMLATMVEMVENIDRDFAELPSEKRDFLKMFFNEYIVLLSDAAPQEAPEIRVAIQKVHEDAVIPQYANLGDAGMDIRSIEDVVIKPGETKIVKTGLAVAIPRGYELQVRPRSGMSAKTPARLANSVGTIDSGYRDEIGVIIHNSDSRISDIDVAMNPNSVLWGREVIINKGDRIAQLVLQKVPTCTFYEVEDVKTIEGDRKGGFGSTGIK